MSSQVPPSQPASKVILIGASAGAIQALMQLFPRLPAHLPAAVLVVVHIPPHHKSTLPNLFRNQTVFAVKEAEDKEGLCAGTIYFAPPDYHLLLNDDCSIALSNEEQVNYSRPSIDVLFESAADSCPQQCVGVILTGGNNDGAIGLQRLCRAGGKGVVQDPSEASNATMPQAAREACPEAAVMKLEQIAALLAAGGVS